MKNTFLLILISAIMASCKSNTKQGVQDSLTVVKTATPSAALIKIFIPAIQGTWVKKAYIDKIIETKSPLAAIDEADLTTFAVNTDELQGDSIKVLAGWGNHDSSDMILKFKPGKQPSSILFGAGELQLSTENGEQILIYYYQDEKSKKTTATKYIKAQSKKASDLGEGTNYLVNKALVAGDYTMTDSLGSISKVKFDRHGTVKGFLRFHHYHINIDLMSDAMDNLDEIGFNVMTGEFKWYAYTISADTLKLYETRPNADSTLLVRDKLMYRLVRAR